MASSLFLGIDTGGTFTDGVLLDPQQHQVVKTTKVLTTHHNLKICIEQVLEQLVPRNSDMINSIRMVSLSTTLATNAIVEGKSRPVGLFLLGYDPELVYAYRFNEQFGTPHFSFLQGGMDLQGNEQAPLDESGLASCVQALKGQVEAFAVSSYAGTLNGYHEERAGELISQLSGLPVVQGHHLTSRLNSIRRATTATLNAGLLSTTYDFMHTVQDMLTQRGMLCPLVVVRGDGSLVSADFASRRPVEIIHSGPATSAIGGLYLAGTDSALVIDIGGTTSDLSLLQNGRVLLDGGEATVGGYPTSVRTIRSRSFGLGGDSQIRFDPRGQMTVGPERVIPIAYLAHMYPEAKRDLEAWLLSAPEKYYSDRLEYWLLRREPSQPFSDPRTQRALDLLRGGPRRMAWLLKQSGAISPVQVDAGRLTREDIIARAGLTPTDLLHATGEYTPWDTEMACKVVDSVARMLGMSRNDFIQKIRQLMARAIVAEIVQFLTGQPVPVGMDGKNGSLGRWMFDQNMECSDPFLSCQIRLKLPLIGIGAPARAFLPPVAEALGVPILFPEHYDVANAVGTVVGNVLVQKEAEVLPQVSGTVITGYLVHSAGGKHVFAKAAEALAYARSAAYDEARAEAIAAGADEPGVEVVENELLGGMYTVIARAIGKPGGVNY
jgi:N-methylhydantoinase A/oxoprolinase/acetone carboxylase beta subunit